MSAIFWILVSIIVLFIFFLVFILRKKESWTPDYYGLFIIGIIWLVLGVLFEYYFLGFLGLVFTIACLINKKKWKKPPKWSELPPQQKKLRLAILIILSGLLIAGIILWFFFER